MKEKSIRVRLSERRYSKLKAYAETHEKTMTQVVEEWIDRLPDALRLANASLSLSSPSSASLHMGTSHEES
ncbi:hypothetical protein [Allocoleopsis sp.]|uniref:hypothetical protein n=1 Tax=Allocoleopsis sp. TaxID=3088169 RepID=UPI002FCF0265